jgi:steroid delta-isomerase-like uncharacterized protein
MSQAFIDAAKAPIVAYNKKDWNAVKTSLAAASVYDEVSTQRKMNGPDEVIRGWQGWAKALPDSQATFHNAHVSGNTVILEMTWRGTHQGPLQTPDGDIPATGKKIEIRACQVVELADGKAKAIRHYFDMSTLLQQLGVTS